MRRRTWLKRTADESSPKICYAAFMKKALHEKDLKGIRGGLGTPNTGLSSPPASPNLAKPNTD